jgi:5-methylcytosine-specific restriction endonuclease McrA
VPFQICEICFTEFKIIQARINMGRGRFCSKACWKIGWSSGLATTEAKRLASKERKRIRNLEYMQHWRKENPEAAKERNRLYREPRRKELSRKTSEYNRRNPHIVLQRNASRRSRKLGNGPNDFSASQWTEMKAVFHHSCAYCGKQPKRLEMDHITPIASGGAHTLYNIVPACRQCNARKAHGDILSPVQPLLLTVAKPKKRNTF